MPEMPMIGEWTEHELRRVIRQELGAGADTAQRKPAGVYLGTTTVTTAASFVDLLIPTGYRSILVRGKTRSTAAVISETMSCRFNNDSTAVYEQWGVIQTVAATGAYGGTAATVASVSTNPGATANFQPIYAAFELEVMDYTEDKFKTWLSRGGGYFDTTGAAASVGQLIGNGTWRSNAVITSLRFLTNSGNLDTGSTFSLYGLGPY